MLERITISLSSIEREALEISARKEFRDIRSQARYIVRKELEDKGLLATEKLDSNNKQEFQMNKSNQLV